jgi:hypothetical protein
MNFIAWQQHRILCLARNNAGIFVAVSRSISVSHMNVGIVTVDGQATGGFDEMEQSHAFVPGIPSLRMDYRSSDKYNRTRHGRQRTMSFRVTRASGNHEKE